MRYTIEIEVEPGKAGNVSSIEFSGPPQTERQRLLREVHALGYETGLIWKSTSSDNEVEHDEKSGWRRVLNARYQVNTSQALDDNGLRDLAAFLRSQLPAKAA